MDSNGSVSAVSKAADSLAAAHQKLLQDAGLQFDFSAIGSPEVPSWLVRFLRFLATLRPYFEIVFWCAVAIIAVMVLYFVIREILRYRGRAPVDVQQTSEDPSDFRPSPARARALLADADRLAAQGHYAEAVHLLLFRSVDDIDERRPGTLRPAFTSRDIGTIAALPAVARSAFARIALSVERSFFGGRDISANDFAECRHAYEAFSLPDSWSQGAKPVADFRASSWA
jgi:hypothetical protein